MPYVVNWLINNEIILMQYQGLITVDELSESLAIARQMIDSSSCQTVHVIGDVGAITQDISAAESIRAIRSLALHPLTGWNITLREKSFLGRIGTALKSHRQHVRFQMCDTLEQALDYMKNYDEQITWDNLNHDIVAALPPEIHAEYAVKYQN